MAHGDRLAGSGVAAVSVDDAAEICELVDLAGQPARIAADFVNERLTPDEVKARLAAAPPTPAAAAAPAAANMTAPASAAQAASRLFSNEMTPAERVRFTKAMTESLQRRNPEPKRS